MPINEIQVSKDPKDDKRDGVNQSVGAEFLYRSRADGVDSVGDHGRRRDHGNELVDQLGYGQPTTGRTPEGVDLVVIVGADAPPIP